MRRIGLAVLLLTLAGCGGWGSDDHADVCAIDADCPRGERCREIDAETGEGFCSGILTMPRCREDDDCSVGEWCAPAGPLGGQGRCAMVSGRSPCQYDSDCPATMTCGDFDEAERLVCGGEISCESDAACDARFICLEEGLCALRCSETWSCGDGWLCERDEGCRSVCEVGAACPDGMSCAAGVCAPGEPWTYVVVRATDAATEEGALLDAVLATQRHVHTTATGLVGAASDAPTPGDATLVLGAAHASCDGDHAYALGATGYVVVTFDRTFVRDDAVTVSLSGTASWCDEAPESQYDVWLAREGASFDGLAASLSEGDDWIRLGFGSGTEQFTVTVP